MHSSQFLRLAQAADNNSWVIVAMGEVPETPGSYPAAWCIIEREYSYDHAKRFAVSLGVLPTEDRDAFFVDSIYDVTLERAHEIFAEKCKRDCRDPKVVA